MFAVIFKAKVSEQDKDYLDTITIMRELAFSKYGCIDFIAVTEGDQEIAISYWESEQDIRRWHSDTQHSVAQKHGREKWYQSYVVEVVEIQRRYCFP